MPVYKYCAAGKAGEVRKGIVNAPSRKQAIRDLRGQGLIPFRIDAVLGEKATFHTNKTEFFHSLFLRRISREALVAVTRQIATLLQAGLPLDKALDSCIGKEADYLQRVMAEVRESVREGESFAEALSRHPRVFSKTFVTIVRAGENSGTLDIVMERLATHMDQQLALRRKIQAAMAYPALMLVVGICVVLFMLAFVVPKVTEIFFDMEKVLPLPTLLLLSMSDFCSNYWWAALLGLGALGAGVRSVYNTPRGRRMFHSFVLTAPLLGEVSRLIAIGDLTKTLGMLLKNGVSLDNALTIVSEVSGNDRIRDAVKEVHKAAHEGRQLADPLEASGLFDRASVQLVSAGEQSGRLDEMLLIIAGDSERKMDARLQMLTSLMEPLMILVIGGLVGFVVMAIMLPILEMSNLIGA